MVIYTGVFGQYNSPFYQPKFKNIEYVCFTDRSDLKCHGWKIITVKKHELIQQYSQSPTLKNRIIKLLPHLFLTNFEKSIYIDSNFIIKKNPYNFANKLLAEKPFWAFSHSNSILDDRNCIYKEASAIEQLYKDKGTLKDNLEVIKAQVNFLRQENYPEDNGLIKGGVLIRDHNNIKVIETMELWAKIVLTRSKRDQLSFNYSAWKTGLDFGYIDGDIRRGNPYFKLNGGHQANYKEFLLKSLMNSIIAKFK